MFEARAIVRFRIDGQLRDVVEPKRGLHAAIVSRIKVMAGLDIAEESACRRAGGSPCTSRAAGRCAGFHPAHGHGERVVLRLLDKSANPAGA